ncbi:MAG: PAS domain S-box protein, partial [Desulfamplus sp.]|nr:PAS domain S-box protein [Desulfamplus sp.]
LKAHPQIEIIEVPDTSASIRAVSVGKADALFDLMPVVDYITRQIQITNLKVGGELGLEESKPIPLHIAVKKDNKALASIIDKGMAAVSEEEIRKLHEKWLIGQKSEDGQKNISKFNESSNIVQVVLTKEEQDFIDNIPDRNIRLGVDSNLPPFEYVDDNGIYSGISADFIIEAAKRIGLNVFPKRDIQWTEAIEKIKRGEIDVIPKVIPSFAQAKFMNFTKPYTTFPSVIVSRKDMLAGGLKELHGLKVGVIKGQIIEVNLKRDYPELFLVTPPDIKRALVELSDGKFDVFIDNLGSIAYMIDHLKLVNLRIAASTPYNYDFAFGVRKDWYLLASALDKSLSSMGEQEKIAIKNRWLAIKYEKGVDWLIVGIGGAVLSGIIIFIVIWNYRLGKAMRDRENFERKIKAMGQAMADALIMLNSQGKVMFWNHAAEKLFGYTEEEAISKDFHDMAAPPEMMDSIKAGLKKFAETGKGAVLGVTTQINAINRSGKSFPVEVSLSPFQLEGEWFAVGSVRDITERKKAEKQIEDSHAQFKYILDTSPIAVAFSTKGKIHFANPKFKETFGVDIGDPSPNLYVNPEVRNILISKIQSQGKVENEEIQMYNKSHEVRDMLITYLPIKYDNEDGILGWILDITEKKKIQDAIVESAKQHKTIFESSPLGMIRINAEGTIINCNSKFVDLMGSTREKLIGFNSLSQGKDEGMKEALRKSISGETAEYETDYISATGGKKVPLHMKFNPVNAGENPTEVIVTLEDIAERKDAEEKMRAQMEDLEKFSRLTINREEKMISLKEEINQLRELLGKGQKYKIVE